jgi:hypothetical protein
MVSVLLYTAAGEDHDQRRADDSGCTMNPAAAESFHYDDVDWYKIKCELDHIGIDADTTMVKQYLRPDELVVMDAETVELRAELERLARQYRFNEEMWEEGQMTASQFVARLTEQRDKVAAACDLFAPYSSWVGYTIGEDRAAEIHHLLTTVVAELQEKATTALAAPAHYPAEFNIGGFSYEASAAKPVRRAYLFQLNSLWDGLTGDSNTSLRRRYAFIEACAAPVIVGIDTLIIRRTLNYETTKLKV